MNLLRQRTPHPIATLILILGACLWFGAWAVRPARGDVGVQPVLPGGSNIKPEATTPIQMAAGVVVMDVRLATETDNAIVELSAQAYGLPPQAIWFPAVAEVRADFRMRNPTDAAQSLTVWFPLASALDTVDWELNPEETVPRIASFRVRIDGKPLDYAVSELPNPKGADKPPLSWASFAVNFPACRETLIQVSYLLPLQPAVKAREMALYYIFQTGAGWAGAIGQAELILRDNYRCSLCAFGVLVQVHAGYARGAKSLSDINRGIGTPFNYVNLFIVQLTHNRLNAHPADTHTSSNRIDPRLEGCHGHLGALPWFAGNRANFHHAVINFRHLVLQQAA